MLNIWHNMGRNSRIVGVAIALWSVGEGLWVHIQPVYLAALGASPEEIGFILAASGLGRLVVMLPAGFLADRYGARRVMLPGWLLGMVGVLLIAASPNLIGVAIGFFCYGTSALAIPVINLYVVQSIEADRTVSHKLAPQEVLTFIEAMLWLGMIASPAIGGLLAEFFPLRTVFWMSAFWFGVSFLTVLYAENYPAVHEGRGGMRKTWSQYGMVLRQRQFFLPYLVFVLVFLSVFMGQLFAPKYLEDVYDWSPGAIGALGSVLATGGFVWNLVLGKRKPWTGLMLAVAITGGAFTVLVSSGNVLVLIGAYFMMGAFVTLRPLATGIMAQRTPPHQRGAAFGLVDTIHACGTFIAPALAGVLYAQAAAFPFLIALLLMPFIFIGASLLARQEQASPHAIPVHDAV